MLETLDENKAIAAAKKRANLKSAPQNVRAVTPPIIVIQKPEDNAAFRTSEVTLEYHAISTTGNPITDIGLRINNSTPRTSRRHPAEQ